MNSLNRKGETADRERVLALGRRYGELDGELAYIYATAFVRISQTFTPEQRKALDRLRGNEQYVAARAYLYAEALRELPTFTDAGLFSAPR